MWQQLRKSLLATTKYTDGRSVLLLWILFLATVFGVGSVKKTNMARAHEEASSLASCPSVGANIRPDIAKGVDGTCQKFEKGSL